MQVPAPGKREREGACGPHPASSCCEYKAAHLCQPPVGRGALVSHTPASDTIAVSQHSPRYLCTHYHRKQRLCHRVSRGFLRTGPLGGPGHENREGAPEGVGDTPPLWQSGPPRNRASVLGRHRSRLLDLSPSTVAPTLAMQRVPPSERSGRAVPSLEKHPISSYNAAYKKGTRTNSSNPPLHFAKLFTPDRKGHPCYVRNQDYKFIIRATAVHPLLPINLTFRTKLMESCEFLLPRQRGCVSYNMTVLQPDHPSWATGRTWTVVLREPRRWVNVRIIRLQPPAPRPVGPNKVIKNVLRRKNTTHPKTLPPKVTDTPTGLADTLRIGRTAESDPNQIFRMLEATFLTLNETKPNLTNSCWLCYDVKPPFYEGIALDTPFNYSTASAPHQCRWDTPRRGITLSQITGQGRCFGNAALANPCVFLAKFNDSIDFCVQVLIVPRVLYHSDEEIYHLLEEPNRLHKREIITGITIAMLLGLGAAGTATGVSAIATQQHGLSQLHMTIDEDLQRIEKSISYLEKSVSSLSEVVLQNRQGLDLLFMQQGGLCAALKEEFSMAELRDRLAQRKRDRETQQSWFESWFNQSHWLTSLISALVGPLAILLLAVTIGPWLLNKVVSFVQARLERQTPSRLFKPLR
uniref:Uncharacterized protein n=1 Tax=Taeniopygia guttata TaxID=59729 RepID=A0A674GES7_TAEGU